ncbi:MAG TPA: Ig-like domain-containing protein [Myxococcaceae bacterium]|nr:Ig-like domain-containing protein [Myxococcaceae bacterium]
MRHILAALLSACFLLAACEPTPETETPATPGASSAGLIATAAYDAVLKAPKCTGVMSACASGGFLNGRAGLGPEANQPNTLGGTCADGTAGTFHSDESIDALQVTTVDGSDFASGKTVRADATVWVYSTTDALDVYASDSATSPVWTLVGTVTPPGTGQRVLSLTYPLTSGAVQAVRAQLRWGGSATPCAAGSYNDHDDLAFDVGAPPPPPPPAPTVAITSPADRSSATGTVPVTVATAPGFIATKMDIIIDGLVYKTLTGPWIWAWDTYLLQNGGAHVLIAKAYDATGNTFTSAPVNVTLHNPGIAEYDPVFHAPKCNDLYRMCYTQQLVFGRGGGGTELNPPNTIDGCQDGTVVSTSPPRYVAYVQAQNVMNNSIMGSFAAGRQMLITVGALAVATTDKIDLWWAADATNPQWTLLGSFSPTNVPQFNNFNVYFTPPTGGVQAIRGTIRQGSAPAVPCGSVNSDWDADDLVITFAPDDQDADAPVIASMSPLGNSFLGGTGSVSLTNNVMDAFGVTSIDYYDGATLIGTSSWGSMSWNTGALPEGPRTVTVVAHDAAGHASAPYAATYTIDRTPPSVAITSPAQGATVSGTVTLKATASDDRMMGSVSFYAGSSLIGNATYGTWSYAWDTIGWPGGTYSITARATDAALNVTTSAPVSVTLGSAGGGSASYDPTLHVPKCGTASSQCDSGTLLLGRAQLGPEPSQPNTLAASTCADGTAGSFHGDESVDRIVIASTSGGPLARGQSATVTVTAWIWGAGSDYVDLYLSPSATSPTWTYLTTLQATGNGQQNLTTSFVVPATATTLPVIRATNRYGGAASPCTTGPYDDRDDLAFTVQ